MTEYDRMAAESLANRAAHHALDLQHEAYSYTWLLEAVDYIEHSTLHRPEVRKHAQELLRDPYYCIQY